LPERAGGAPAESHTLYDGGHAQALSRPGRFERSRCPCRWLFFLLLATVAVVVGGLGVGEILLVDVAGEAG
jgi:hypothetical protein